MESTIKDLGIIIFAIMLIGFMIWWCVAQWQECKMNGFSNFYCIQHVF